MFSDNRNAVVESLIYFSDIRGIAQDREPRWSCIIWRAKISAFREGVHSCVLTFDATNVPLDGAIVLSVPFSGTAVKHGNCQFQFHPS